MTLTSGEVKNYRRPLSQWILVDSDKCLCELHKCLRKAETVNSAEKDSSLGKGSIMYLGSELSSLLNTQTLYDLLAWLTHPVYCTMCVINLSKLWKVKLLMLLLYSSGGLSKWETWISVYKAGESMNAQNINRSAIVLKTGELNNIDYCITLHVKMFHHVHRLLWESALWRLHLATYRTWKDVPLMCWCKIPEDSLRGPHLNESELFWWQRGTYTKTGFNIMTDWCAENSSWKYCYVVLLFEIIWSNHLLLLLYFYIIIKTSAVVLQITCTKLPTVDSLRDEWVIPKTQIF